MGRGGHLNAALIARVKAAASSGESQASVAKVFGISRSSVYRVLNGKLGNEGSGRKHLYTPRQEERLKQQLKKLQQKHPAKEVTRKALFSVSKLVKKGSRSTQARWLKRNYDVKRPREGIVLEEDAKRDRCAYAAQMVKKTNKYYTDCAYLDCIKIQRVTSKSALHYATSRTKRFEYVPKGQPAKARPPTKLKPGNKKNFGPRLQLAVVFFRGRVFAGQYKGTLNGSVLEKVLRALNKKMRRAFGLKAGQKITVLQDNDPVQNSSQAQKCWAALKWKCNNVKLECTKRGKPKYTSAYSPDLSPLDGCLFGTTQTELHRKLTEQPCPRSQTKFDALYLRTLKSKTCATATLKFLEGFRTRLNGVLERGGEMMGY